MYTKMFMEVLLMSVTNCEQSIYQEGTAWINYITSVQQNTIGSLKKKGQYLSATIERPSACIKWKKQVSKV